MISGETFEIAKFNIFLRNVTHRYKETSATYFNELILLISHFLDITNIHANIYINFVL